MTPATPKPRAGEQTLAHEVADLSRTISTDSDGAFLGDFPEDHLGNIAGYIGKIEALNDTLRARGRELAQDVERVANSINFVLGSMPAKMKPGLQAVADELRQALAKHGR